MRACPVEPPSPCNSHDDECGRRWHRRTRSTFRRQTDEQFRVTGIAYGRWCYRLPRETYPRAGSARRAPGSAAHHSRRRRIARRRGQNRRQTRLADGTTHVLVESTRRVTNPPRPAASVDAARRCARRLSAGGNGHGDHRGSPPATTPERVPLLVRLPAAASGGATDLDDRDRVLAGAVEVRPNPSSPVIEELNGIIGE